jgi:hypothetical protein
MIGTARGNLRCSSGQPPCSTETALGLAYRSRPAGAKPDRSLPTPVAPFRVHHTIRSAVEPRVGRCSARAPGRFPGAGRGSEIQVLGRAS